MTPKEFINILGSCYDYTKKPGQLALIAAWVQNIPAGRLQTLFDSVTEQIDTSFGSVADLARVKVIYRDLRAACQFIAPPERKQIAQVDAVAEQEIETILAGLCKKYDVKRKEKKSV